VDFLLPLPEIVGFLERLSGPSRALAGRVGERDRLLDPRR
jgi:hypothetical protein